MSGGPPAPYYNLDPTRSSSSHNPGPQPTRCPNQSNINLPPQGGDCPRESFSTFSVREPGRPGFDNRQARTSSTMSDQREHYRVADQYNPNPNNSNMNGQRPSSETVAIPGFASEPMQQRASYGQGEVQGGGARMGNGDSRVSRNGDSYQPRQSPNVVNRSIPNTHSGHPNQYEQPPSTRTEQLRDTPKMPPTGPSRPSSTRPLTPVGPRSDSYQPRSNLTAQPSSSDIQTPERDLVFINDEETSELSSLAKLRQFKASIATKRSKQLHDVDSDALAEMAASFLASANAVPPLPSTAGAVTTTPGPDVKPVETVQFTPPSHVDNNPPQQTNATSAPASEEAGRMRTREEELKERLKALKKETGSGSIPTAPSGAKGPIESKPDIKTDPKHKLEDGEITDEASKRAKVELMPTSASTTASQTAEDVKSTVSTMTADSEEPRSAGQRKRAQEWMKTTASTTPTTVNQVLEEVKAEINAEPVGPGKELESRIAKEPVKRERQDVGDKARSSAPKVKVDREMARSRSPVKTQRESAGGFKDPTFNKNRQLPEEKPRISGKSGEIERDSKPSLADRISKDHAPSTRQEPNTPRAYAASTYRPRGDSIRSGHDGYDTSRRSRSPPRGPPASRPIDSADRGGYDRDRGRERDRPITNDRPEFRGRERELSPYAMAHQRKDSRDGFRDDRPRYPDAPPHQDARDRPYPRTANGNFADSPSGRGPPPAPRAPEPAPVPAAAGPSAAVLETLAILRAQIAQIEAPLVAAAAVAPPAPIQAPQPRYPPFNNQGPAPSFYRPDDRRPGYNGNDRDRYDQDRRPISPPPHSRLPPSQGGYDRRPLTPNPPAPLHAHTAPSRYNEPPLPQQRYNDSRAPDWETRPLSPRGPPARGGGRYDGPPRANQGPPVNRNGYDQAPRDFQPPIGEYGYRAGPGPLPVRGVSPPPRPYGYDQRGGPPPLQPDYRDRDQRSPRDIRDFPPRDRDPRDRDIRGERYPSPIPANRPRYSDQRRDSPPPPPGYGRSYPEPEYDNERYLPPSAGSTYPPAPRPSRPSGGFDNRAGAAGGGRGGAPVIRPPGPPGRGGAYDDRDRRGDSRDREFRDPEIEAYRNGGGRGGKSRGGGRGGRGGY